MTPFLCKRLFAHSSGNGMCGRVRLLNDLIRAGATGFYLYVYCVRVVFSQLAARFVCDCVPLFFLFSTSLSLFSPQNNEYRLLLVAAVFCCCYCCFVTPFVVFLPIAFFFLFPKSLQRLLSHLIFHPPLIPHPHPSPFFSLTSSSPKIKQTVVFLSGCVSSRKEMSSSARVVKRRVFCCVNKQEGIEWKNGRKVGNTCVSLPEKKINIFLLMSNCYY